MLMSNCKVMVFSSVHHKKLLNVYICKHIYNSIIGAKVDFRREENNEDDF